MVQDSVEQGKARQGRAGQGRAERSGKEQDKARDLSSDKTENR